jgi:cellulose synthase/poly-beta-1,6-N-acetylglucosamine synthase-like glycosyltransferase
MQTLLFYFAIANLVLVSVVFAACAIGGRSIVKVKEVPLPESDADLPSITLVVAARNEARNIEAGVRSLLALDYPKLELIAVNDRSTDDTGKILDRIAKENPRLMVTHLTELPKGWLGKNHALHWGAEHAKGELLLFTDADVVLEPTTVKRAAKYLCDEGLDHLCISPEPTMPNWFLEAFVVAFSVFLSCYARPWKAKDPRSKAHIGIGAFNLLRLNAYHEIGTLQAIAMRPDDDIKLGKLVKLHGKRQEMLAGIGMVHVPWYSSLREVVVGLEKNTFAAVDYRISAALGGTFAILAFNVFPFIAVFLANGAARWMYVAVCYLLWLLAYGAAVAVNARRTTAFAFPVVCLVFVYIQWRSMALTLANDGIRWRDTHYSLAELKANRI